MTTPPTAEHPSQPQPAGGTGEDRVVVGVDGSPCGTRALEFAAHEAALRGALLHVVSAYEVPPSDGWAVVPLEPFEQSAAVTLTAALTRAHDLEPRVMTKGEHCHGFPGSVLVGASHGACLLVVGSRGHGEVTNLLIGSVSEHCVHHAACPVTVVR